MIKTTDKITITVIVDLGGSSFYKTEFSKDACLLSLEPISCYLAVYEAF